MPAPFFIAIFDRMGFESTAFGNRGEDAAGEESLVRRTFWKKTRRLAARLPFADDLVAAYYCAFDRDTPLHVKTALIGALAYFVVPADVLPDVLPALGYADDATVVATTVTLLAEHIRPLHRDAARAVLEDFASGT
ncbi:MAG: YkvA family protein [Xanthobacteraceae bacterium]